MAENNLPENGAQVTAYTLPSIEYDRLAREVRGTLTKRWVAVFGYWQCDVDGVEVDHRTVRSVGGES